MSSDVWPGSVKRRETLMRLPLGDLAEWHLLVTCESCRAERIVPLRDLITAYGPERTLVMLVPRLRCRIPACRRPPSLVRLRSRFPAHPGPPIVDVVLAGRPARS
jgi:hypothetical protein